MIYKGIKIDNTFAEAFNMKASRIIVTADNSKWARNASDSFTGFATSVIACGCEAGIEKEIKSSKTPDGRPGIAVLLFAMNSEGLAKQVMRRVGQCILTSPTTACYSGMESEEKINLGNAIRYFGDGFQISKKINNKKIWRVPVMEGEFIIEDKTSIKNGIGGGNILIIGNSSTEVLKSAEAAVKEMRKINNIIF